MTTDELRAAAELVTGARAAWMGERERHALAADEWRACQALARAWLREHGGLVAWEPFSWRSADGWWVWLSEGRWELRELSPGVGWVLVAHFDTPEAARAEAERLVKERKGRPSALGVPLTETDDV